jgi:hypothetical protein
LIRLRTSMTRKVQDIDDFKGLNVQDIDDPIHNICNLILSIKQLVKGESDGTRTQKNSC